MDALAWVLPLRHLHVGLVVASGALFAVRGLAVLAQARWPMQRPARVASMAIDTLLLTAGVSLWTILSLNPWRDAWLGAKLALLLVYIMLGTLALRRARRTPVRAACLLAALVVSLFFTCFPFNPLARGTAKEFEAAMGAGGAVKVLVAVPGQTLSF